jgi:hypothetical protein
LPLPHIDRWSITRPDALALGAFLERYPRKVVVIDIGTFIGVSAFCFASQPNVLRVISVDPNPEVATVVNDAEGDSLDPELFGNLRVLDIAQASLARFTEEQQKIQFLIGTAGSINVSYQGIQFGEDRRAVEVPALDPSEEASLVAFVDGLHTPEGVQADLEAIYERNPHAIAFLHDCRDGWGPFVQAGIARFMGAPGGGYRFYLFECLAPGVGIPRLGLIYPEVRATEIERVLVGFQKRSRFLLGSIRKELSEPLQFFKAARTLVGISLQRRLQLNDSSEKFVA